MSRQTTADVRPRARRTVRTRNGRFSRRLDLRIGVILLLAGAVTVGLAVYGMTLGAVEVPFTEIPATLIGQGSGQYDLVVLELRLPRVAVAVLAGIALGVSGALFQSFARNPLVSPDIIGVNTGASLVAVALLTIYSSHVAFLPLGAFAGAIAAAAVVYLNARSGHVSPYRLVLIGIGVDVFCRAGVSYLLVQGESMRAQAAVRWMVGSLDQATPTSMWFLTTVVVFLVPAAMLLRRPMEAMTLGEDTAKALGADPKRMRMATLAVGVMLAASVVAICGPISFVAFIAPHMARRLANAPGTAILPVAGAVGALLVLVSDLLVQHVIPASLPLGVITPLLGGPYFLYLLRRVGRQEAG